MLIDPSTSDGAVDYVHDDQDTKQKDRFRKCIKISNNTLKILINVRLFRHASQPAGRPPN